MGGHVVDRDVLCCLVGWPKEAFKFQGVVEGISDVWSTLNGDLSELEHGLQLNHFAEGKLEEASVAVKGKVDQFWMGHVSHVTECPNSIGLREGSKNIASHVHCRNSCIREEEG